MEWFFILIKVYMDLLLKIVDISNNFNDLGIKKMKGNSKDSTTRLWQNNTRKNKKANEETTKKKSE